MYLGSTLSGHLNHASIRLSGSKQSSRKKSSRAPLNERQRNLVITTDRGISPRLVSYHLKSCFLFVCFLCITSYRRRIQNIFCNLRPKRGHPLSEDKQNWNQEKTLFLLFCLYSSKIEDISKNKNYLNHSMLSINSQWPIMADLDNTAACTVYVPSLCHQKNNMHLTRK